jgi:IS1 family transposase
MLQAVNGKRAEQNTKLLVRLTAKHLNGKVPQLMTGEEYKPYQKAVLETFGGKRAAKRTFKRGQPKKPYDRPKPDLVYTAVHKIHKKGKAGQIDYRTVFGTDEQVQSAREQACCSRKIKMSLIERQNRTDRNRSSRKVQKSSCFSKDGKGHRAATCVPMDCCSCCRAVRTCKRTDGKKRPWRPAMAAGLTE